MRKIALLSLVLVSVTFADNLWSYTQKGKRHYEKGNYEKALEQFDHAVIETPNSREARYNRALTLAQLGQVEEAQKSLEGLEFSENEKQADLAYTRGNIADIAGNAAMQKQDFGAAKKAYSAALQNYVETLSKDSSRTDALKNVELTAGKLSQLPEPPEDENKDDQNKDDQNKDQNEDDQEKDDQEKDDQNKDQNEDDQEKDDQEKDDQEKDEENKDEENKDDEEEEKEDENKDDENKDEGEEEQEENQPPQPEEPSPEAVNAMQLLEKYGDDAEELNKPPVGKAVPVAGGKDW